MQENDMAPVPLLPEILALHGKWRGTDPALLCDGECWSWRELTAASHRFAHGLLDNGVEPGDRVGVVMSNGKAMVQTLLGIMAAGAVSVPINLSVSDDALLGMMRDAEVSGIVVTPDQKARVAAVREQMPTSCRLYVCATSEDPHWRSIASLCDNQSEQLPSIEIADHDLLNIIYSSGTTGTPKGIAHSHRARRDWAYDLSVALRYHGRAKTLLTIGLYSNISWVGMLCTLLAGGTLVVHRRFDAGDFLVTVEKHRITHTAMVPVQYQRIVEQLDAEARDVSSMQAMMCCGSPLHASVKQALFERFSCGVIELYGLTEGIITTLEPENAADRWTSVGRPLIGTDLMIVGDDGEALGPNNSGEIVSRGRIAMREYYRNAGATAESQYIDDRGRVWLRSGDIGYLDDEGYLYIVDRKKDMILSGGQNIYPQDIEAILKQNPDVYDVAVIGVSSQRWGETPLALVIPAHSNVRAAALLGWANGKLGKQQRLADLLFVEELPRNPNGKLLKRELRKEFKDVSYA